GTQMVIFSDRFTLTPAIVTLLRVLPARFSSASTWTENSDSMPKTDLVTAASSPSSGGMSEGGLLRSKNLCTTSGAGRLTLTGSAARALATVINRIRIDE